VVYERHIIIIIIIMATQVSNKTSGPHILRNSKVQLGMRSGRHIQPRKGFVNAHVHDMWAPSTRPHSTSKMTRR